jgi:hypothetical protein
MLHQWLRFTAILGKPTMAQPKPALWDNKNFSQRASRKGIRLMQLPPGYIATEMVKKMPEKA